MGDGGDTLAVAVLPGGDGALNLAPRALLGQLNIEVMEGLRVKDAE